jgi:glycosyltransferase involved in cell wall biosynthesis
MSTAQGTNAIWFTWEKQRRNRSMAKAVGARLEELEFKGGTLARYWTLARRTFGIVRREKPGTIYFQNPSIVLATLIVTMKVLRLTRATIVGDYHNAGVHPPVLKWLVPWLVRHADLTLVSNANLGAEITAMGGRALAMPDPIPALEPAASRAGNASFEVLFVCSWADDEPIADVLRAARALLDSEPDLTVSITGRPKLEKIGWHDPVPANVKLTGFLSEHDFDRKLTHADAILDLTTRADCMVCGAYEAAAAEVPMILSDNPPTREYFSKGALFTDNSAESIAALIREMRAHHAKFRREVVEIKQHILQREQDGFARLAALVKAPAQAVR